MTPKYHRNARSPKTLITGREFLRLTIAILLLTGGTPAHAQWQSVTYSLKSGWNAIYLHGEAKYATPDVLFGSGDASNIQEIWRWNPNPNEVQFTETPLITSAGTPEWSKWIRGGGGNTLSDMRGQSAYLVKCGAAKATYSVPIVQKLLPPSSVWMRQGANLLGFPARTSGNPTFSNYFASFPAAIAANTKIYKYVGGDLGPLNPLQVFSPLVEVLDRNSAYWFSSEVVGDFYAPLEIDLSNPEGIAFGKTASVVTALIRNRTAAPVTVTMAEVASAVPPSGQTAIEAGVPLTLGKIIGLDWNYDDPISGANNTVVIGPESTVEIRFGVNRAHASMAGAPANASFASLLRFTDSGNLMDVYLPVTANKTSLAGLWAGEITVNRVGAAPEETPRAFPLRTLLHVADDGTARLLSQVFVGTLTGGDSIGLCTKESGLKPGEKGDALRFSVAHLPLDRVLDGVLDSLEDAGSGSVALPSTLVRRVKIPFDDPTNPFVHQYHPDHDNRDARPDGTNTPKGNGEESFSITRTCTFNFTASPPDGFGSLGWGSSAIGGTYSEELSGLHRNPLNVSGTFLLRRVSEIGALTINP